ncbi:MAG: hypothetical protein DCF27_10035 [Lysobacteraceae bacterium]|nr:MAG: hypothetical protein DCF27_10035 [Xanthomonadaceae bacterium]
MPALDARISGGRRGLGLLLTMAAMLTAASASAEVLAPRELAVDAERGYVDIALSGLPALPSARFATTVLAAPTRTMEVLEPHPSPGTPYDVPEVIRSRTFVVPGNGLGQEPADYRIRVSTLASSQDIELFVGVGPAPRVQGQICRSAVAGPRQFCEFTVQSGPVDQRYWLMVQNRGAAVAQVQVDSVVISSRERTFFPLAGPDTVPYLVATGPGRVPEGSPFDVRIIYDDPSLVPGTERFGYVLVKTGDTVVATIPVNFSRTGEPSFQPFALANGVDRPVTLPPGTRHDRLYIDVPAHGGTVQFSASQSTGDVELYVARQDWPATPTIGPAPAWNNVPGLRRANAGDGGFLNVRVVDLPPGRWYAVVTNPGTETVDLKLRAQIYPSPHATRLRSGQYVNPARDGHGLFLDFAGPAGFPDQWLTVWYTYLQDGTPTWYYSQGRVPFRPGLWKAELFRVVWDGAATHAVDVGDVIITETGAESMVFSFNIDGQSGSEPMVRVGGGTCPSFGGQVLDVSGHWYSPSMPGFGYTYQATGGANPQEVFIPYLYDDRGMPRWLYGQKGFDGGADIFAMQWFTGFAPLAPRVNLTGTAAGTATRTLAPNDVTGMSVAALFSGALQGSWHQDLPVARLSQPKFCR